MSITFFIAAATSFERLPGDRWFRDVSPAGEQWAAFEIGEFAIDANGVLHPHVWRIVDLNGHLQFSAEVAAAGRPVWEIDDRGEWFVARSPEGVDLNVGNETAAEMLFRLGLQGRDSARGRELVAACDRALKLEDRGRLGCVEGRVHDFGRPAGRVNDRIRELRELAVNARDLGVIFWG